MMTEAVLGKIDGEWIADLTEEMVKIPSVTMDETEVCSYYERQLVELGDRLGSGRGVTNVGFERRSVHNSRGGSRECCATGTGIGDYQD